MNDTNPTPARRAAENIDESYGFKFTPKEVDDIESLITAELAAERAEVRKVLKECLAHYTSLSCGSHCGCRDCHTFMKLTTLLSKLEAGK